MIAPSSRIAGLCHSVIRGEPYSTCQLGCAYCYARWYRGPHGEPRPLRWLPRLIRELGRAQRESGLLLPVRIATLSDPFQPAEARWRVTLAGLREASRQGVPVVLNTRLQPPSRGHWRVLRDLASQGLLLVQVTVTGLDQSWPLLRRLEPGSPPPRERLASAAAYAEAGAPVVVRLQPLIPGIGDADPGAFAEAAAGAGARLLIVEFLRAEKPLVEALAGLAAVDWEPYVEPAGERLLHPGLSYRLRAASTLSFGAWRRGLAFQTCKEGLFHLHHPVSLDCCGFRLLRVDATRRPHLYDVYLAALGRPRGVPVDDALEEACRLGGARLCGDALEALPGWLRRGLALHERRLQRILRRPSLVEALSPVLRVRDGRITAAQPPVHEGFPLYAPGRQV